MNTSRFAAIDLGATSGRVMIGEVGEGSLRLHEAARFANRPVPLHDGLHWSVLALYNDALAGVAAASQEGPLAGVGVDSWAVDYALLRAGSMLSVPFSYRDARTERGLELIDGLISQPDLFARCGLQRMPFTTVNQLAVDRETGLLQLADRILLLPDLFSYWLTGRMVAERTNASTTGLLALDDTWDADLMGMLGITPSLVADLVEPGTRLGAVSEATREHFGIAGALDVFAVASHDTASAVAATPLVDGAAYISSGTWSLVGIETPAPIATPEAAAANFTNEGGVDGRNRFLKNVMGMWLLSESLRTWQAEGASHSLESLLAEAADYDAEVPIFDTTDDVFYAPGDMPSRIAAWFDERGIRPPSTPVAYTRSILESLAAEYAHTLEDASRISGQKITQINIVGGGSRNTLLSQLTARRTGLPVYAGPVEATALGNVLMQARGGGVLSGDLATLRELVALTHPPQRFAP